MPVCTITYNAASGSDAAASGSNAPTTAVTGTNGDISTTTFTLNETVDFTGVNDDDSDVLWVNTPAGDRHLYRITAFNPSVGAATTLTVTPSAGTARTADSWAVGGRRQTPDNDTTQTDIEDGLAGWQYEYEAGTYTYANGAVSLPAVGDTTTGPLEMVAAAGASPTVTCSDTGSNQNFLCDGVVLYCEGIAFTRTGSTWLGARAFNNASTDSDVMLINCSWNGPGEFGYVTSSSSMWYLLGCDVESSSSNGFLTSSRSSLTAHGTRFHDCSTNGVYDQGNTGLVGHSFVSCVFDNNGAAGMRIDGGAAAIMHTFSNCVFHNNTGDGIWLDSATPDISCRKYIVNCIFTENGSYGIEADAAGWDYVVHVDYNAFRNNTSGTYNNVTAGANDVTLTADPYTATALGNFTINSNPGGGLACEGAGTGYAG